MFAQDFDQLGTEELPEPEGPDHLALAEHLLDSWHSDTSLTPIYYRTMATAVGDGSRRPTRRSKLPSRTFRTKGVPSVELIRSRADSRMSPASKPLEIDARWLYRRSFFLFFLVFELLVWRRLLRFPMRAPGHRVIIFLLARWATPRSFLLAIVAGGVFTLLAVLVVRLIVRPLLNFWLNPSADSSWGLFHLTASETIVATIPARRLSGWIWKPGSLALTNRRLWFFPANGNDEPWFLRLDDVDRIVPERPALAALGPIRNWPEHLHVTSLSGPDAVFATAQPSAVVRWIKPV